MKTKIITLTLLLAALFSSCDDILDRPQLTKANDDNYWTDENKLRLFANEYYERFFIGYGLRYNIDGAAFASYLINDDIVTNGNQSTLEISIPKSRGENKATTTPPVLPSPTGVTNIPWLTSYTGPDWSFAWVRKSNIMIDRINDRMGGVLTAEAKNHWLGIARFFRAIDYAGLVTVFGDVPYFDHEVADTDTQELYKPRTPRNTVMDAVYDDWVYALNNVRVNDGDQYVNRYVVAAYITRLALVEGTWQKYHYNNTERAGKFLKLAVEAGDYINASGKYDIVTDFRSLFASKDLKSNKDCILYRHYDAGQLVTHSIATACNVASSRDQNPNLDLIKAFICNDGQNWESASVKDPVTELPLDAKDFNLSELAKTRDPRFEATFFEKPTLQAKGSLLFNVKFISREATGTYLAGGIPSGEYLNDKNTNDYPVMRYAEVLLNWIEAKAVLAEVGGSTVTQTDINISINKIRNRPLDAIAIAKGVTKTSPMTLTNLPNDPKRDADVSALIWEIRRERRMELAFEHSRLLDLRRWKKLDYMDTSKNPDLMRGTWLNASTDLPAVLVKGISAVTDMNGKTTVYTGSNASAMVGFYSPTTIYGRTSFLNLVGINPYLAPVGITERISYKTKGFNLAQTEGWASDL